MPNLEMTPGKIYKISGRGISDDIAQSASHLGFSKIVNNTPSWPGGEYVGVGSDDWTYNSFYYTVEGNTTAFQPWVQVCGWPATDSRYDGTNGVGGWYWTGLSVRDMAVNSMTLYAQWKPITYNILLDLNKGKDFSTTPTHAAQVVDGKRIVTATFDLPVNVAAPRCKGYIFEGWDISGMGVHVDVKHYHGNSQKLTAIDYNVTGLEKDKSTVFKNLHHINGKTVTFTARWTPNKSAQRLVYQKQYIQQRR